MQVDVIEVFTVRTQSDVHVFSRLDFAKRFEHNAWSRIGYSRTSTAAELAIVFPSPVKSLFPGVPSFSEFNVANCLLLSRDNPCVLNPSERSQEQVKAAALAKLTSEEKRAL